MSRPIHLFSENPVVADWNAISKGDESAVVRFVEGFFEASTSDMDKTLSGTIDTTYLCSRVHNGTRFDFVLKCIESANKVNTLFCTHLFSHLRVNVPLMFEFKQDSELAKATKRNIEDKRDVLFMKTFPGCNLGDFIETNAIFSLNREDWGSVLSSFGKIAVFDLIIGNSDRFYYPEGDGIINNGNVMIHTAIQPDGGRKLEGIYYIDTGMDVTIPGERFVDAFKRFHQDQRAFAEMVWKAIEPDFICPLKRAKPAVVELFSDKEFALQSLTNGVCEGYEQLKKSSDLISVAETYLETSAFNAKERALCEKVIHLVKSCMEVF